MQNQLDMSTLLSTTDLPGFDGIDVPNRKRDAWNFDEASSYLKYSLCQIELDRQTALANRFDREGKISKDDISEVWGPLRKLTNNLLPHMEFDKIDVTNRDQVQCFFRVHSKGITVDIDDLSSGEKAVVQLFYPLVEHQVKENIKKIVTPEATAEVSKSIAVLIDEPELHLHPNLQGKILDYIRKSAVTDGIQFVLATHSPTMVEQANSSELYLLRPSELVDGTANQLVQIASDEERLALMREVFGSTSNITAMRPMLVVEGSKAGQKSRSTSDARIYGFLSDRFGQISIVSGGGKSQAKALAQSLSDLFRTFATGLKATPLLDRDVNEDAAPDGVMYLPVSMIENLLVDPQVIWDAIVTVRHKVNIENADAVAASLDQILDEMIEHKTSRRVKSVFDPQFFRLRDPVDQAQLQIDGHIETLKINYSKDKIDAAIASANEKVSALKAGESRREFFDGKLVLDEFYKKHLHESGMSKEIFVYECARQASTRKSVGKFVEELFTAIGVPRPATD